MARLRFSLVLVFLVACHVPSLLLAQGLSGSVGVGYAWQHTAGSGDSYASQFNLSPGFNLDELSLVSRAQDGGETLSLTAWGFGGAEPTRRAHLFVRPADRWRIEVDYSRRTSFFGLAETDLSPLRDSWELTRWKGKVTWEAGSAFRLTLAGLRGIRRGTADRAIFALNDLYPLHVGLDETMTEGSFRAESLSLPVHLAFEQSFAKYIREDRFSPNGTDTIFGGNPNQFVGAKTDRQDERKVPTSRLSAAYQRDRLEVTGGFLYSKSDLTATGMKSTLFDIDGGTVGRIEFVDSLLGSATQDTRNGYLRLGLGFGRGWTLRLIGDLRDSSTDGSLLGQRLFRVTNPAGGISEVSEPVDDASQFDVRDTAGRVELEKSFERWAAWIGGFAGSRDVSWRTTQDAARFDVNRRTSGGLAGVTVDLPARLHANVEFEKGSFTKYVFRTDPETVDRLTGRLNSDLGLGIHAGVRWRYERAENPSDVAGLRHHSRAFGFGGSWDSPSGRSNIGVDLDLVDLTTDTGLVLPTGANSVSTYDLSLISVSARVRQVINPVLLELSGTRVEDHGNTWPVDSWNASGRVTVSGPFRTDYSGFVQYYSYHESRGGRDDFRVTRYGLGIRRSFE